MPATPQAAERLRAIVTSIEGHEADKKEISTTIKEAYDTAKGEGYDPKVLRKVVSLRRKSKAAREEEAAVVDLYLSTLEQATANVATAP